MAYEIAKRTAQGRQDVRPRVPVVIGVLLGVDAAVAAGVGSSGAAPAGPSLLAAGLGKRPRTLASTLARIAGLP